MRRYEQNWLPEIFNDFFINDWMTRTSATAPAINRFGRRLHDNPRIDEQ